MGRVWPVACEMSVQSSSLERCRAAKNAPSSSSAVPAPRSGAPHVGRQHASSRISRSAPSKPALGPRSTSGGQEFRGARAYFDGRIRSSRRSRTSTARAFDRAARRTRRDRSPANRARSSDIGREGRAASRKSSLPSAQLRRARGSAPAPEEVRAISGRGAACRRQGADSGAVRGRLPVRRAERTKNGSCGCRPSTRYAHGPRSMGDREPLLISIVMGNAPRRPDIERFGLARDPLAITSRASAPSCIATREAPGGPLRSLFARPR